MFAENRREKLLTLFAMCFALFMAMLDNTVVNVALPKIQAHLGAGVSGLQWVVDAYTLLFASLLLTGGTLGDIYGRKRLFQAGRHEIVPASRQTAHEELEAGVRIRVALHITGRHRQFVQIGQQTRECRIGEHACT